MSEGRSRSVAVFVSGASGACYARAAMLAFVEAGFGVHFACTERGAEVVLREEGVRLDPAAPELEGWIGARAASRVRCAGIADYSSPLASGSSPVEGVVVAPCSMGTLSRIACGNSSNLLERSADVALKEGLRLVLVPRETPLSRLHLERMLALSNAGATIMPACPAFHFKPGSPAELADFMAAKILQRFGLPMPPRFAWGG